MQLGEVKEHNTTEALFADPQHAYTRRLLSSEPSGSANPLPDDAPILLDGRNVRVSFTLKKGGFFRPRFKELVAVDGLSLKLRRHETLGLVGESGSGKTTFGQALIRLLNTDGGEVYFEGEPIHDKDRKGMRPLRSKIQIVFQDPFSSLNPRMSVGQIIEEGLIVNGIGANRKDRLKRVEDALVSAGMLEKLAPTLLAGMPAIVKPASPTAYLAELMVRRIVDTGLLPEGALQLVCGSSGDLLDHGEIRQPADPRRHRQ